jgi:hypothetical protein
LCPLDNQCIAYVTAFAATPPATAPAPPPTPPSRKSVHQQARTAIVGLTGAVVQREEPGLCTKQSALEATLRKHRGSRVLIFCCAPELEHYAAIVRTQQLSATLDVADFKADPTITALLLSHADSSGLVPSYSSATHLTTSRTGVNVGEAQVLIRISIDSLDPGQVRPTPPPFTPPRSDA